MGLMVRNNFKDYWLKKLLFPGVFTLDKSGVIISGVSRFFGSSKARKRDVYHFEIIFRELMTATISETVPQINTSSAANNSDL